MTYDLIIKEIEKILLVSKGSTDVSKICYFTVDKRFEKEFTELIDFENTWHELVENADELRSNIIALKFEARKTRNEELAHRLEIILDNVSNKPCSELKVIMGYILCRSDEKEFIEITKKLHIGPYKPLKDASDYEKIKLRYETKKSKIQFERINYHLTVKENESLKSAIDISNKAVLYLQSAGYLKQGALEYLKDNLEASEYIKLLDDLYAFSAITKENYDELKHKRMGAINYSSALEELVQYFQSLQDVQIDDILKLKPMYGKFLIDSLIFELVKKNIITNDEYQEFLKIKNDISLN